MANTPDQHGSIHLGDLLRALETLPWQNEEQAAAIIRSLGFIVEAPRQKKKNVRIVSNDSRLSPDPEPEKKQPVSKPNFAVPPQPQPPAELPAGILKSELELLPQQATTESSSPDWLTPPDDAQITEKPLPKVHRQPLIADNTSRGILTAALVTQREGDAIDIHGLIDRIVTGHIPQRLPRLPAGTLERGCQLLLHYSDDSVPYWEDMNVLLQQAQQVIGATRINLYEFTDEPLEARCWNPADNFSTWQPKKGVPVLVATDIGLGGGNSTAQIKNSWRPFIQRCETAGSPLILLIPWRRKYWPEQQLGPYPYLIHWSPHTTAAMVRHRIGEGHAKIS